MSTQMFRESLTFARRAATPLICIRSADPSSAIAHMVASMNGKSKTQPIYRYDFINGLVGYNSVGVVNPFTKEQQLSPPDFLLQAQNVPADSVIFFLNIQLLWSQIDIIQGIWNLRDLYKHNGQMMVLITTPGATLPTELASDISVFDEPLPSAEDLKKMVKDTFESAGIPLPKADLEDKIIDALIGLASFPAEQVLAMSLSPKGVDTERLWERKKQVIEQARGLAVWRGGGEFSDQGGSAALKQYFQRTFAGKNPPRVLVFLDEIEKAMAGTGTDTSGTKTELSGTLLTWLQDHEAEGIILLGPPGVGKSAIAKAAGATAGIPTIAFDFAGMQSGIVGSSGENLRAGLAVVEAISQGRSLWIATSNNINSLSPELRRRFPDVFFMDLPDTVGRDEIWKIYETQLGLKGPRPNDEGWTGAEIRNCCKKAWKLSISLCEAAAYIVPISVSSASLIDSLRRDASGKFLSATKAGTYTYSESKPLPINSPKRKFAQGEN